MNARLTLSRREALARIAVLMGGAVIGGDLFLRADTLPRTGFALSSGEVALLDEIGETIIPTTTTPGAKSVGIGAFMVMMVDTCYDAAHQAAFRAGLTAINAASTAKFGHDFLAASVIERTSLLNELDLEQRRHTLAKAKDDTAHYFRMMKQLTLLGFFTSETGATKVLHFAEVPGRYDGNVAYKKGDGAWYNAPSRFV
jgi:hypothetical protein